MLEGGAGGADMEFADIAQSVHKMWVDLNSTYQWWWPVWTAYLKRFGSSYRSGRSRDWLKMKKPEAPAVKREAEEDWGRSWTTKLIGIHRSDFIILPGRIMRLPI